jgi:hypothetical protein
MYALHKFYLQNYLGLDNDGLGDLKNVTYMSSIY